MEDSKKALILSIIGILVLIIAVVGVSFAMFTFSGTGTKENVIRTGTVTMDFVDSSNNIELTNAYPTSDAKAIENIKNRTTFGVKGDWSSSPMTVVYDLGLTNIVPGTTLTNDYIKVALLDGNNNVLVGEKDSNGKLKAGVKISTLINAKGSNNLISEYSLTSGTITAPGIIDSYTIIAYVSDDYKLPTTSEKTDNSSKSVTKTESYSFKVGIKAKQS